MGSQASEHLDDAALQANRVSGKGMKLGESLLGRKTFDSRCARTSGCPNNRSPKDSSPCQSDQPRTAALRQQIWGASTPTSPQHAPKSVSNVPDVYRSARFTGSLLLVKEEPSKGPISKITITHSYSDWTDRNLAVVKECSRIANIPRQGSAEASLKGGEGRARSLTLARDMLVAHQPRK